MGSGRKTQGRGRKPGVGEKGRKHCVLTSHFSLLVFLSVSGCGFNLFSSGEASIAAHTVMHTRGECTTFVAQTLREGMTIIESNDADYMPNRGDVFEGPARIGPSVFRVFDGTEPRLREGGRSVALNIIARNLTAEDARTKLEAACGG